VAERGRLGEFLIEGVGLCDLDPHRVSGCDAGGTNDELHSWPDHNTGAATLWRGDFQRRIRHGRARRHQAERRDDHERLQ
jgi:hypothetical protein